MKENSNEDRNSLYKKAEDADRKVFAEMRSNILLVAGEHYTRAGQSEGLPRSASESKNSESRLRLTKNHSHRLSQTYVNALLQDDPDVQIGPQVETDIQDKKDAALNQAVWRQIKKDCRFRERKREWAQNFVNVGEVCVMVRYDYGAGEFTGEYEPLLNALGEPEMEATGGMRQEVDPLGNVSIIPEMAPIPDRSKPVFSGGFVWEEVLPYNLLRDPSSQSMDDKERPWIIRKMVSTNELKRKYKDNEDVMRGLKESPDDTFVVFDANRGNYDWSRENTMVREYYWRPSLKYPMGRFEYRTDSALLEEGELPKGRLPFAWARFLSYPGAPRGKSIISIARAYQVEINRAGSKIAETQITAGDDKIIYSDGGKVSQGANLPGIRGVKVQGAPPTYISGRDGSQFMPYMKDQIAEFEQVTMMGEISMRSEATQMDPYLLLYQAASKKKAFKIYQDPFDQFLVDLCEINLDLAKEYLPDDALIPAIGAREAVNIAEFRKTSRLTSQITIEPGVETLEAQFGKQLNFQHMLQYVGKQLDMPTIGKMAKEVKYGNPGGAFEDFMLDETIAENTMLKLERGEQVSVAEYVSPDFMLKKIERKIASPEFETLSPEIQNAYRVLIQEYQAIKAEQEQKIIAAKNEYIPTDGALVPVQVYVQDPTDPNKKASLARLPYTAIQWLMQRLEEQGASQEMLQAMSSQNLSEMASQLMGNNGGGAPQQNGFPPPQLVR